jgi:hypothetical protein
LGTKLYAGLIISFLILNMGGGGDQRWRSWLRHSSTSKKVVGSIPDGIIGLLHWHNPSGRSMILRSTQPVREMSTRNISRVVKAAAAWRWQPYHLNVPLILNSGCLNVLKPSGPLQDCIGIALLLKPHQNNTVSLAGAQVGPTTQDYRIDAQLTLSRLEPPSIEEECDCFHGTQWGCVHGRMISLDSTYSLFW